MPANPKYDRPGPKDWSPLPKKTYYVTIYEVHTQIQEVEAHNKEEARAIVADGGGEPVEGTFAYSHTLDPEEWRVEEKK
jgi:hypothetical protein